MMHCGNSQLSRLHSQRPSRTDNHYISKLHPNFYRFRRELRQNRPDSLCLAFVVVDVADGERGQERIIRAHFGQSHDITCTNT